MFDIRRVTLKFVIPACVACLGFMTPTIADGQTLYALERDGPNFRIVDRVTGADISTISSSVVGGWRGMAMDPTTGTMFATDAEYLYTIDLATGNTTQVDLFGDVVIRDLTFDDFGRLYGVTGSQGSDPHSLHVVNPISASVSLIVGLNGTAGHGIAYDPRNPERIYHLASGVFERIDLTTGSVTPIGLSGDAVPGRSYGLLYDPIDDIFRFFDSAGRYYSVDREGVVTATGSQNATRYLGLGFDQRTTEVILFRDGFDGGTTDVWSAVQVP